ncbi:hypothetical protein RHGRI_001068 [Rhododendron griersonianum]|uniref:Uncharacterized protein n=1 Tax=Rhododendron griersonianum TaxID=479676 RepID=A0AAV6LJA3_9ERIC|nr:hypothetical protein RHGRI_001068 [Rhododendron griersonianum]
MDLRGPDSQYASAGNREEGEGEERKGRWNWKRQEVGGEEDVVVEQHDEVKKDVDVEVHSEVEEDEPHADVREDEPHAEICEDEPHANVREDEREFDQQEDAVHES